MKNKIILMLLFLLLISLATPVSAEESKGPPYVSIDFEVKSREEILLEVEISRFVMPTFWDESKFVIGFYSPTEDGIKSGDVSADCMENYVKYSLFAEVWGWAMDNTEITTVVCKFPSELESLSQISKLNLEITLFESRENSEFISGEKADFPMDEYILNLYVVFLTPVEVEGRHAAVLGNITLKPGLQSFYRINAENIETPLELKSKPYFLNASIEPVVYYTGFKFGTTFIRRLSHALFFWPLYVVIIVGVLTSLLLETKKVALSLHIILASFILLLTQHIQFVQIVPSEISRSFSHAITLSSSLMLMFSLTFVSLVLYYAQGFRENESVWKNLVLWQKFVIGLFLLGLFIGTPIYALDRLFSLNFLNLDFWLPFFLIPGLMIFCFLGFLFVLRISK